MIPNPEAYEEKKVSAAKPGRLELLLIIAFLLLVAWGTYEFGIYLIKQGALIKS